MRTKHTKKIKEKVCEKSQKVSTKVAIISSIVGLIVYLILDYINIFQLLGLSYARINVDTLGIVINAVVVIVLYVVTYHTLDKRQIKKEDNAKKMADLLMLNTYTKCYDSLSMFLDKNLIKKYIIPKVDFDKLMRENEVAMNICNMPFSTSENILNLAENGHVDNEDLQRYLTIQKEFKEFISDSITFYDLDGNGTHEQNEYYRRLQLRRKNITEMLVDEIRRLS